jgi:hypothetical protein
MNKMMDCETKVIFTKDPTYIIKAHSWPEEHQKKQIGAPGGPQNPNQPPGPNTSQNNGNLPNGLPNGGVNNPQNANTNLQNPNRVPGQQIQQPTPNVISANINTPQENQDLAPEDPGNAQKNKLNKKERREFLIKEMRSRIDQYFEINVRQIGDMVPKIITNFLINDILVN